MEVFWLNISPVFPGLMQSPSGAIFDQVCCPPHCGILVSPAGPAAVGRWWLLDQLDPLGKANQEEELLWLVFGVCLGPEWVAGDAWYLPPGV